MIASTPSNYATFVVVNRPPSQKGQVCEKMQQAKSFNENIVSKFMFSYRCFELETISVDPVSSYQSQQQVELTRTPDKKTQYTIHNLSIQKLISSFLATINYGKYIPRTTKISKSIELIRGKYIVAKFNNFTSNVFLYSSVDKSEIFYSRSFLQRTIKIIEGMSHSIHHR